jgi:dienelactone hydrolase
MPTLAAVKTQKIEYKHGDTVLEGFLAYDDAAQGRRPAVLVCPEWWGLNDYIRGRAEQLAKLGYVAFAADMYGQGITTTDPKEAGRLAGAIYKDPALMRERVAAALKVLTDQKMVDGTKVAAIGYCFGGKCALELARSGADLAVVVSFHGDLSTTMPAQAATFRPHVLVCNGADDQMVSAEAKQKFEDEMRSAKADFVFIDYANAVHAFTNPKADSFGIPGIKYNETADRRSWAAMRQMFDEVMGPAGK